MSIQRDIITIRVTARDQQLGDSKEETRDFDRKKLLAGDEEYETWINQAARSVVEQLKHGS